LKKIVLVIYFLIITNVFIFSQDNIIYNNIYSIINREIVINANLDSQSLTLIYENNNYYIFRRIFGSDYEIAQIKYKVIFNSEYKITSSEVVSTTKSVIYQKMYDHLHNEIFEIYCNNELRIYLNGIEIKINQIIIK
jgi:hypothetical protein